MTTWLEGLFTKGIGLVQAGMILFLIFAIATTWFKSRALIPTAIVAVTGGAVLWLVNNYAWLETNTGSEFSAPAPAKAGEATSGDSIRLTSGVVVHLHRPLGQPFQLPTAA
jgi:hypothetical protein